MLKWQETWSRGDGQYLAKCRLMYQCQNSGFQASLSQTTPLHPIPQALALWKSVTSHLIVWTLPPPHQSPSHTACNPPLLPADISKAQICSRLTFIPCWELFRGSPFPSGQSPGLLDGKDRSSEKESCLRIADIPISTASSLQSFLRHVFTSAYLNWALF